MYTHTHTFHLLDGLYITHPVTIFTYLFKHQSCLFLFMCVSDLPVPGRQHVEGPVFMLFAPAERFPDPVQRFLSKAWAKYLKRCPKPNFLELSLSGTYVVLVGICRCRTFLGRQKVFP